MNQRKNHLVWLLLVVCLPSCIRTYKLVPSESPQGSKYKDQREVVKDNLRSVKVYNEWETAAAFDVLWMSEQTQRAYVDSFCMRRGKDTAGHDLMLQTQLAKNESEISFYVLADVRDKFHPSLKDKNASWTMYLELAKSKILPTKIEEVELDPEILALFGHRYAKPKFKIPYLVTFAAKDLDGKAYITPATPFKMVISSVARLCVLGWQGDEQVLVKEVDNTSQGAVIKDEDYYWI
jgi:hypothetical protein